MVRSLWDPRNWQWLKSLNKVFGVWWGREGGVREAITRTCAIGEKGAGLGMAGGNYHLEITTIVAVIYDNL
jgi:hypothetical protein